MNRDMNDVVLKDFLIARAANDWDWVRHNINDLCDCWADGGLDEVLECKGMAVIFEYLGVLHGNDDKYFCLF